MNVCELDEFRLKQNKDFSSKKSKEFKTLAKAAMDSNDYNRAKYILEEYTQYLDKQNKNLLLESAKISVIQAKIEDTFPAMNYEAAAELYHEAVMMVKNVDQKLYIDYLRMEASVHYKHGVQKSNVALEDAIKIYKKLLTLETRDRVPLDWAMTQNNLGNALSHLGNRSSDDSLLKEAVAAYREALLEYTRERVPLQWATTQNNLGTVLGDLGTRSSDDSLLKEAVAAYREALLERTRERVPLQWAMTQNNLGTALRGLDRSLPKTMEDDTNGNDYAVNGSVV